MATKKQKFVIPAPLAARKRKATIVEEAIDTINRKYKIDRPGNPAELRRRLSDYAGRRLDPQLIYGWRQRGNFPRDWIPIVAEITGIPLEKMVQYKSTLYEE